MRFFNLIKIFQKLFWNPRRRQSEWYSMLNESYGVHFYSSMKNSEIVKFPEFYGDNIPAYLAIALDHCPVSYWSKNDEFQFIKIYVVRYSNYEKYTFDEQQRYLLIVKVRQRQHNSLEHRSKIQSLKLDQGGLGCGSLGQLVIAIALVFRATCLLFLCQNIRLFVQMFLNIRNNHQVDDSCGIEPIF